MSIMCFALCLLPPAKTQVVLDGKENTWLAALPFVCSIYVIKRGTLALKVEAQDGLLLFHGNLLID